MYSRGGGGGEHDDDSDDCNKGGGGGMILLPALPVKGENEILVTEAPVRVGLTAKGFGMGLGNCLSFDLKADKFVGREDTRKANGGVTDLVSSLGLSASSLGRSSSYFFASLPLPASPLGPSAYILTTPLSQDGPSPIAGLSTDGAGESE